MRKKDPYTRIVSLILCLGMLFSLLVLAVGAREEYIPVEWELDENLEYLYGGEKRYERYYVRGAFYGDANRVFHFANSAAWKGKMCQVYGESADPHIVSVGTEAGYHSIFVDEEGKEILDAFLARTDCIYYLESLDNYNYTEIGENLVAALEASYQNQGLPRKWVDVRELGEADILEITVHDRTETKAYQHGAVYIMPNGSYYYVCFETLDNRFFDADGFFSYRSGSVHVYELDKAMRTQIDEAVDAMAPQKTTILYERYVMDGTYDVYGNPIDETDSQDRRTDIVLFFVLTVFAGFLLPLAALIVGLALAHSKKTGRAKCWYALSICAVVWMLAAALFMLLVAV